MAFILEKRIETNLNDMFWYSLFCVYKWEYLLKEYPDIWESISEFHNAVLKSSIGKIIYKCILGAEHVNDDADEEDSVRYYNLIFDNLDLYNYIIKY